MKEMPMQNSGKKCEQSNYVPLSLPLLKGADQIKNQFFKISFYFFARIELTVGSAKIMGGCHSGGGNMADMCYAADNNETTDLY